MERILIENRPNEFESAGERLESATENSEYKRKKKARTSRTTQAKSRANALEAKKEIKPAPRNKKVKRREATGGREANQQETSERIHTMHK